MKNEDVLTRFTENYKGENFDIIIVGGGISGAAIAYDAASRGLSVALIEKKDFGGATSAVTSKLIHGGLRYLATMEFGLVRESLRERRIMENIAPNFVYPLPFMVTTNRTKLTNTKWVIKIGMMLYDILSFDKAFTWDKSKRMPLHTTYSKKKVLELEPNVRDEGLTGASVYYDCVSIFPERLTLAFIKSAVHYGAKVANYAEAVGFLYSDDNRITGVRVLDTITGRKVDIAGRLTLNCGGPWADIILGLAKKKIQGEHLRRSEGIHLITRKLINDHAIGSITSEGRHIFVIPWRGHSLIGTTDKEYIGSPDEYRVTAQSISELLDEVNASFGDGSLSFEDVLYAYGGLRPLVEDQTKDVYESSRKYEIYDNRRDGLDGLITVEGGKYTTSRNLAENVLALIGRKLGQRLPRTITDKTYLQGSEIPDINDFLQTIVRDNPDFEQRTLEYLGKNYGLEYSRVLEIARRDKSLAETVDDEGEILAQVAYAARHESAKTLNDILFRRTGIGTLGNPGDKVLRAVARVAARELGWSPARTGEEIEKAVKILTVPRPDAQKRAASKKRSRGSVIERQGKRSNK